jgi:hypothetical protein
MISAICSNDANGREPAEAEGASSRGRQINHVTGHEWTAIVDANHH